MEAKNLQPLIRATFVGVDLVSQGVPQTEEQMTTLRCIVWAVQCVDEHFPAQLNKLAACEVCDAGSRFVLEEADQAVIRALAVNLTYESTQLLDLQLHSDAVVAWKHLKHPNALAVLQD